MHIQHQDAVCVCHCFDGLWLKSWRQIDRNIMSSIYTKCHYTPSQNKDIIEDVVSPKESARYPEKFQQSCTLRLCLCVLQARNSNV